MKATLPVERSDICRRSRSADTMECPAAFHGKESRPIASSRFPLCSKEFLGGFVLFSDLAVINLIEGSGEIIY